MRCYLPPMEREVGADSANQLPARSVGVPESSADRSAVWSAWIAAAAAIVAAAAGVMGVAFTNSQSHTEAALDRRAAAYADYLGGLAEFNELMWSASAWSGDEAPSLVPEDNSKFWASAQQLQSELETSYVRASLATTDQRALERLNALRTDQQAAFLQYKCGAGLQQDGCGSTVTMAHAQIVEGLTKWSAKLEEAKQALLAYARTALN